MIRESAACYPAPFRAVCNNMFAKVMVVEYTVLTLFLWSVRALKGQDRIGNYMNELGL